MLVRDLRMFDHVCIIINGGVVWVLLQWCGCTATVGRVCCHSGVGVLPQWCGCAATVVRVCCHSGAGAAALVRVECCSGVGVLLQWCRSNAGSAAVVWVRCCSGAGALPQWCECCRTITAVVRVVPQWVALMHGPPYKWHTLDVHPPRMNTQLMSVCIWLL